MRARAFNRLTGNLAELPAFSVAGIWASQEAGTLNGLSVLEGAYFLPDVRGLLTWRVSQGSSTTVSFPNPGEDGLQLGSLEAALTGLAMEQSTWSDWIATSPLDRDLAQELQRFPLEEAMELNLQHLEAVCHQPRTHLEIFEERQLVSRARQIPVRAVNYLASHTEDWEGRTLRGVRPRRVITNVRDDLYDIYENRVSVRLVDHLSRYVRRRLARIKELTRSLQTIDLSTQEPPSGMHWRQKRIYRLWGESLDLTEAQLLASERMDELNRFLYRLERLRGSLLYTNVPTKSQVPAQLRITNILGNDPHYRRVARLWLSWYRYAHTGHPSLQEQQKTAQHEATQFDRYVFLLTLHALDQFDFVPVAEGPLHPGTALTLTGPEGPLDLSWNFDGTSSLHRDGREVLRVVASTTPLSELRSDEVADVIQTLANEATNLKSQAVLLYPAAAGRVLIPELQTVSGDPHRIHPKLSCIPVSTVDLESVERLARVLRWVLTGERIRDYPYVIASNFTVPVADLPANVIRLSRPSSWEVLAPLKGKPLSWTEQTRRLELALDDAKRQVTDLSNERGQLRQAQRKVAQRQAELDEWNTFLEAVEVSQQRLTNLRRCPVCGTEGANFAAWQEGQFNCHCGDCGAEWSLRRCQDCHEYHPWLLPHLREIPQLEEVPGWADQLYGRDILTLPDPLDLRGFTCPVMRQGMDAHPDNPFQTSEKRQSNSR